MRFFFGFLAFIAAAVVVILLVVGLFKGLGESDAGSLINTSYSFDEQSSVDSVLRYKVAGPVSAEEDHREVRITISRNVRTLEVIKGYNSTVISSKTYSNSPESYKAFLGAMKAAKYADYRATSNDPISTCVTGEKFHFEANLGSEKKVDSWTSSCSFNHGSFAGNQPAIATLFRNQIPDYNKLISGVNLRSL